MIACACSGAMYHRFLLFLQVGWCARQLGGTLTSDPDRNDGYITLPPWGRTSIVAVRVAKEEKFLTVTLKCVLGISWNDVRALPLLAQTPDERERGLALDCESPLTAPGRMFRPPSYICSTPGRSIVKLTVRHALSLLVTVNGHPRWDSGFGASGLLRMVR